MFAKECVPSLKIQKYEALLARLVPDHPLMSTIQNDYKRWLAGYKGEKSLEFYLNMLPEKDYLIFHNIRLPLGKYFFQMDYLILCQSFALVLEVKNRVGEYRFEKHLHQTTLTNNGIEERIQNPVVQARLQAQKLKRWLRKQSSPDFPVHYLFVNSHPKATVQVEHGCDHILRYICHNEGLIEKATQIANTNKQEIVDQRTLRKLKRLLLASHTEENFDILTYYQLTPSHIRPGVFCPKCDTLPMRYKNGKWVCLNCTHISKTAHLPAIHDYFLLLKPSITNAELRQFLQIASPSCAYKILKQLDVTPSGSNKHRIYLRPSHPANRGNLPMNNAPLIK